MSEQRKKKQTAGKNMTREQQTNKNIMRENEQK